MPAYTTTRRANRTGREDTPSRPRRTVPKDTAWFGPLALRTLSTRSPRCFHSDCTGLCVRSGRRTMAFHAAGGMNGEEKNACDQ